MTTVISVEHLSKSYHLGQIGTGTFAHDLNAWWAKVRGKPNPRLKIGQVDHGNSDGQELWALKDVSFTVEQGEVLGIIGRNGAGKSTLLKILSRVTAPTSGKIKVKGRIASLLEVGTGFHPELTGRENTYLNGAILGMSRKEIDLKFDEIVDFAGIEKFIDTPVRRYSSGMYVRLAFAVAAHLEPEILVVDEVLAVGDAEFQKKCLAKMGDVAREGRTVLFVSHNMAAVQSLCTKAIVLSNGQLSHNESKSIEAIEFYLRTGTRSLLEGGRLSLNQYRTKFDQIVLTTLSVRNSNNNFTNAFQIGENIILDFEVNSKNLIEFPHIGIGIYNYLGIRIFTVSTRFNQKPFKPFLGSSHLCVLLRRVLLTPGEYVMKATFGEYHSDVDIVDNVPVFEILASDYWGSGKLPDISQGVIIQDVSWFSQLENQNGNSTVLNNLC